MSGLSKHEAPVPSGRIAVLREEIRRAGREAAAIRILLAAGGTIGLVTLAGVFGWYHVIHEPFYPIARAQNEGEIMVLNGTAGTVIFGALPALLAALVAAAAVVGRYRRAQRDRTRRLLLALPAAQRAAAAGMLREFEHGEAQRIVGPLLDSLDLPTEVAPAAPPDGRGNEPGAAEQPG